MTRARKRILVVFTKEWDREAFARDACADYELVHEGFDLFRFPSSARLLTFEARAFVERLVERWRGRIDGVFSNNEYFGALIAAAVAERLGLPGTPPRSTAGRCAGSTRDSAASNAMPARQVTAACTFGRLSVPPKS